MTFKFILNSILASLAYVACWGAAFTAALGGEIELARLGVPFKPGDIPVIWGATNRLPEMCPTYRVIAHPFTSNTLSLLLDLGGFTERDRTTPLGSGVLKDRDVRYYQSQDRSKTLVLAPSQGWIVYKDKRAESETKDKPDGVPSLEEAVSKSEVLISQLGIRPENLATNPATGKPDYVHAAIERSRPKAATKEIVVRYVFFRRLHDGISFHGPGLGGIRIGYGNQGRVSDLEIVCREVSPARLKKTAEPQRIVRWIKEGRSVISSEGVENVRSLRITNAEVRCLEYQGYERQKSIQPFALLNVIADTGQTNISVQIFSPIFGD